MRPAHVGAFVPIKAEPAEAVQDRLQRLGDVALLIGVVDAQDKLAAVLAGEEPVEKGCADAANVEIAGRAGGETGADHDKRFQGSVSRNAPAERVTPTRPLARRG